MCIVWLPTTFLKTRPTSTTRHAMEWVQYNLHVPVYGRQPSHLICIKPSVCTPHTATHATHGTHCVQPIKHYYYQAAPPTQLGRLQVPCTWNTVDVPTNMTS